VNVIFLVPEYQAVLDKGPLKGLLLLFNFQSWRKHNTVSYLHCMSFVSWLALCVDVSMWQQMLIFFTF